MISAVILAAGQSRRMGKPKINLPWGKTTVLGQIINTLHLCGIEDCVVVTGSHPIENLDRSQVELVRFVVNPQAEIGEMLSSIKIGLSNLKQDCQAALIVLGDQPQIEFRTVRMILESFSGDQDTLLIPSFQMRRGHPWLLGRRFWPEVLELQADQTLRDFINQNSSEITYLNLDTPTVLMDMDTPEEYEQYKPKE